MASSQCSGPYLRAKTARALVQCLCLIVLPLPGQECGQGGHIRSHSRMIRPQRLLPNRHRAPRERFPAGVFVTGEPGIGKTTMVEAFLEQVAIDGELWIGRGQCIEHYGAGEAYLPVLEALGRLCREPGGQYLIELLHQHAPTWLVQMPALLGGAELEALQRKTAGTTRDRMLRELTEVVGALTRSGRLCCAWRICSGAMSRPWTGWRLWRGGRSPPGCW